MKKTLLAVTISALAAPALALDPLPQEAGFSGVVALGAAGGRVESNFLAKIVGIDLGDDLINQQSSPDDTDVIIPVFQFNVGYTFANKTTRVHLGTTVDSSLDFSANSILGVRNNFDSIGNIEVAALLPSALPVKVWENPYAINQKRSSTEYTSTGGRISWDKMFGTGLEVIASARKIDINKELSGQGLVSPQQQKLLDRQGDVNRFEVGYMFNLSESQMIRPSIAYVDRDLDGGAMSQDGYELGVSYMFKAKDFSWVNRAVYQSFDGDKVNPLFNKTNDADIYLLASEVRVPNPFGWEHWTVTGGVMWADNDADIEFNQSSVLMAVGRIARSF
ncbi:MAG: DUF2860 family protein [Halioglobus sp.]|nr:DUF2860 family protein [Halioglobus sp.]